MTVQTSPTTLRARLKNLSVLRLLLVDIDRNTAGKITYVLIYFEGDENIPMKSCVRRSYLGSCVTSNETMVATGSVESWRLVILRACAIIK